MDGLLLDSERLARDCFLQACADVGWPADLAAYDLCVGGTYESTERILIAAYGPDFPYARLSECWGAHYEAYIQTRPVAVKAGARELLDHLADLGIPRALATSTRRATALQKLRLAGLEDYFSHLVCGGETPRGKPHPDPYLEATRRLSHPPGQCWALEDSNNGVRAAHAAGLRVFQVPDLVQPDPQVAALGHQVVGSLFEVLELLLD
ncbi:MAG: HAD family phosphatase [Pseudomonadales bacterium]|nr:HAD family phosphatase [Pseudomonadales bacterium]